MGVSGWEAPTQYNIIIAGMKNVKKQKNQENNKSKEKISQI